MKFYARKPGTSDFFGPLTFDEIQSQLNNGSLTPDFEMVEAVGQSHRELKRSTDWKKISEQWTSLSDSSRPGWIGEAGQHQTGSTITVMGDSSHPLYGVAGWLRFFVIVRIYIAPIASALILVFLWVGTASLAKDYPGATTSALIHTLAVILLTGMGVIAGIRLRDRLPDGVRLAKQYLIIALIWSGISPCVDLAFSHFDDELGASVIVRGGINFVRALVGFAIWFTYFKVSKRVRATYLDRADERKLMPESWRDVHSGMTRTDIHSLVGPPLQQNDQAESWTFPAGPKPFWHLDVNYGADGRATGVGRHASPT